MYFKYLYKQYACVNQKVTIQTYNNVPKHTHTLVPRQYIDAIKKSNKVYVNSLHFSKYELCRSVYSLRGGSIHSFCPLGAVKEVQRKGVLPPP